MKAYDDIADAGRAEGPDWVREFVANTDEIHFDNDPPPHREDDGDTDDAAILPMVNPAELFGLPVPQRMWHVPGLIPHKTVTALSGDGGTGKSLLAQQLAVSTAIGRNWIGMPVEVGRVMYLSAEDDMDEVWRRLVDITAAYDADLSDLENMRVLPLAGLDAVLAAPSQRSNVIQPTALWHALEARIALFKPRLIVLDTLADLFAGDEIQRAQARQFIGLLRGLAIKYDLAVLLLLHPSLSGMASGRGSSGSTAWVNSIRSFLYLERVLGEDSKEIDADIRTLKTTKANYGRVGSQVGVKWSNGVFTSDEELAPSWIEKGQANSKAEAVFLDLLKAYTTQGRYVSASNGPNFAPSQFASNPLAKGMRSNVLRSAMNRLFESGKIATQTIGSGTRAKTVLVVASGA